MPSRFIQRDRYSCVVMSIMRCTLLGVSDERHGISKTTHSGLKLPRCTELVGTMSNQDSLTSGGVPASSSGQQSCIAYSVLAFCLEQSEHAGPCSQSTLRTTGCAVRYKELSTRCDLQTRRVLSLTANAAIVTHPYGPLH